MNQKYLEAITAPLRQDMDEWSEDNELYAFLDEEMVKFGSLRAHDLDWHRAEEAAIDLLRKYCKHLRVLAHLSVCLQQSKDAERYLLSIKLINVFLENHWDSSHPLAGSRQRSLTIKKKILTQILQRTIQFASRLDLTEGDQTLTAELSAEAEKLEKNVHDTGIKYEEFWRINNDFNKALPKETAIPSVVKSAPLQVKENAAKNQEKTTTTQPTTSNTQQVNIPQLNFDVTNEREVKQTLFKVATLLNSMSPQEPLGYRVRRFALWFSISTVPLEKKNGVTEMMPVLADRVLEYTEAIENNPSEELFQHIEHSVASSPFWLNGSYLSSHLARTLGHEDISEAIREETLRFTKRLPGLLKAKFSDGTDFVDETTRQWLRSGSDNATAIQEGTGAWGKQLQSALQVAKDGNYKDAMLLLEKGTREAEQPRNQFYWRLATADFMENTGMKAIAKEEYRSLLAGTEKLLVHTWEPMLIDLLKQKAGTIETPSKLKKDS